MSLSLFWKSLVFWVVVLLALSFAVALIPGSDRWPQWVGVAVILPIALGYMLFLKRKKLVDTEAYKTSPRMRRNMLILNIVTFSVVGAEFYFIRLHETWDRGVAVLCGVVALLSGYRLYQLGRDSHPTES